MKKLYRQHADRKIAGICSGLADYLGIDPVIVRLFFLFSVFFGGLGFIAYAVLWLLVPPADGEATGVGGPSRLMLSARDRKLAGVCGGLGEYFALDPVFFRVAFVIMTLSCGVGLLLYLTFWFLVPRAPAPPVSPETAIVA